MRPVSLLPWIPLLGLLLFHSVTSEVVRGCQFDEQCQCGPVHSVDFVFQQGNNPPDLYQITCTKPEQGGFPSFPTDLANEYDIMIFRGYNWSTVTKAQLAKYLRLSSLSIEGCGLTTLENNTFSDLINLKNIHLEYNRLKYPKAEWFNGLSGLLSLNLKGNGIGKITGDSLGDLKNLQDLQLADNALHTIDLKTFKSTPSLVNLYLNNNSLALLPDDTFKSLKNLALLQLDHNDLTTINHGILPPGKLTSLKHLYMGHNRVNSIEDAVFSTDHLPKLEYLHLKGNQLKKYDENWFLPKSNVNSLDLSLNGIKSSGFQILPIGDGDYLPNLQMLNISFNQITKLRVFQLSGLPVLTHLHASHNEMEYIDNNTFQGMESTLRVIDVSNNKVKNHMSYAFSKLTELVELDLTYNELTLLPRDHIPKGVQTLKLLHNHWLCVCDNYWMAESKVVAQENGNLTCVASERKFSEVTSGQLGCSSSGGCGSTLGGFFLGVFISIILMIVGIFIYRRRQRNSNYKAQEVSRYMKTTFDEGELET